jgi:hypothetical protein
LTPGGVLNSYFTISPLENIIIDPNALLYYTATFNGFDVNFCIFNDDEVKTSNISPLSSDSYLALFKKPNYSNEQWDYFLKLNDNNASNNGGPFDSELDERATPS